MHGQPDQLVRRGEESFDERDFEAAADLAREALGADGDHVGALDLLGSAATELGDFEAADEAFARLMALEPKEPAWLLAAADVRIRQPGDDPERTREGLALLERARPFARRDPELAAELDLLLGLALAQEGHPEEAIAAFDRVLAADPEHPEARLERAVALFEARRFGEARETFEALLREWPDEAWAHHYLGLLAERRGDNPEPYFARARQIDPEEFQKPVHLSAAEFDAAVAEAIAALPEHAKPHLDNVIIRAEELPSDEDLKEHDVSPTLLGLFRGQPVDARSPLEASHHQTAQITLYQKNLERFSLTREALLEQIRITVLHEVGHLLGLDEDDLAARGLD